MAKCPNCGAKLHWYDLRAECKHCGTNIPNYDWEARLEADADIAEASFARLHYHTANFKSATVGSPLRIVRLVCTLLPLAALVVPLLNATFAFPLHEGTQSVSFLSFVLDYLTKFDLSAVFALLHGEVLGTVTAWLLAAAGLALLAVAAGVVNFFVVLLGAFRLHWVTTVVLNAVSLLSWSASALCLLQFTAATDALSAGLFSGTVSPFYLVGVGLFLLDLGVDIAVGVSLHRQKKSQPTIEEAVEQELAALRAQTA